MYKLAKRVNRIKTSPTMVIDAKVKALLAKGVDVTCFIAGEPDFETPVHIREAGKNAIDAGFTRYTPVSGIDDLKDAIIAKMKRDHDFVYLRNEISVACGAKNILFNIFQTLIQEGDEVIIPAPCYVSYPDQVDLAGGTPVFIKTDEETSFKITPSQLEAVITANTKALILNSPCNPTGTCYSEDELRAIGKVCLKHNFIIISDDVYERMVYDGRKFTNIVQVVPELKSHTLIVNGVSKTYAMTGWRLGYVCGPKEIIVELNKIQSQSISNASSIAQKASVEALNGSQDTVTSMNAEFEIRRNYIVKRLNSMPGVSCLKPDGAFYVFPNFSGVYGKRTPDNMKISNSVELTNYLLEYAKVALVPGIAFGADNNARLAYTISLDNIVKGMNRIEDAIITLQ